MLFKLSKIPFINFGFIRFWQWKHCLLVQGLEHVILLTSLVRPFPLKKSQYTLYQMVIFISVVINNPPNSYASWPTVSSSMPSSCLIQSYPSASKRCASSGPPDLTIRPCIMTCT